MKVADMSNGESIESRRHTMADNLRAVDFETQTSDISAPENRADNADNHDNEDRPPDNESRVLIDKEPHQTIESLVDDEADDEQYEDDDSPEDEAMQEKKVLKELMCRYVMEK